MRILGIDPGLAIIGLGIIETKNGLTVEECDWCTIETPSGCSLAERLTEIGQDLAQYLDENKPELAVIEKLYFSTNQKTALDVAHARGVIVQTVNVRGIPMIEPTPLQLKHSLTGDGQADKTQVLDMVMRILKLETVPTPDDAADALALALFGAHCPHLHPTL